MQRRRNLSNPERGHTLVELVVVVAIILIVTAIAIPQIGSTMDYLRFRGAISSVRGAIQSTHYLAISQGFRYRLAFTKATSSYQVTYESDPANKPGTYVSVPGAAGNVVAWNGAWNKKATISADTTLQFNPSGSVNATTGALTFTLAYLNQPTETFTISTYGRVSVTP
jgi:prepilin-type N-terminal cleavage/methylation domain-containing protein